MGLTLQMNSVQLLWHVRPDDTYADDAKLIGVYRTVESAQDAIQRLHQLPGFRDYPDGFQIEEYQVDVDHWTTGFVSL